MKFSVGTAYLSAFIILSAFYTYSRRYIMFVLNMVINASSCLGLSSSIVIKLFLLDRKCKLREFVYFDHIYQS